MWCNAAVTIGAYSYRLNRFSFEAHGNSGCGAKTGADRAGQIHPSAAGAADSEPRLSRRVNRGRGHGRLRKKHAVVFAEALAGNRRLPVALYGMEFLAPGKVGDAARQAAPLAYPDYFFAAARRGLCRPLRAPNHAVAAGGLLGAG